MERSRRTTWLTSVAMAVLLGTTTVGCVGESTLGAENNPNGQGSKEEQQVPGISEWDTRSDLNAP